jgi:pimeloyl-ACP methyl ester carboxylesterase
VTGVALVGLSTASVAQTPAAPPESEGSPSLIPSPTLGGVQFWADELLFHQWRIQRNVVSGHCRLLDGNNLRHEWGSFEQCRATLEEIKRRKHLPPMAGKAVILLHGLGHSRAAMNEMAKFLEERGGYTAFCVGYPSTRQSIAEHAQALAGIVKHLDGIEEINFVAHSMGNIVIRRYLSDESKASGRIDPRIKRFVMLGPPNQGSIVAANLADNKVFSTLFGKPGQQLGREWAWLEESLRTPPCEFGIIAGGLGNEHGFNPLLPGDDDGIVTVESTRLDGAKDFVVIPVLHMVLMDDGKAQQYTLDFLKTGRFEKKG